ncbi:MAG: glucuronate isomerase [Planctomycetota bacterium]
MPASHFFDPEAFLLTNSAGRTLYAEIARDLPINDFHNHLSPQEIAEDRPFHNLCELWLEHDHYKWRAMRAAGIAERYITGEASPEEKFGAWVETLPQLLRNPLYDWNRLELWMFFGITELLTPETATRIWDETNRQLRQNPLTPSRIFSQCRVASLGTTDDPADSLQWHQRCREQKSSPRIAPTFRPDRALAIDEPADFIEWLTRLSAETNRTIESLDDMLAALEQRHQEFDALGCRFSDHGLPRLFAADPNLPEAARIFRKVFVMQTPDASEIELWGATLMHWFAQLDASRGWTKQLHLGPQRNNSARLLATVGRDAGADSIGDWPQVQRLQRYFDQLECEESLSDHIVYVLNPSELYPVATMLGNFNSGPSAERSRRTRIRLGAAWWFFDHRAGIREVLNCVAHTSLLAEFPGMVTDSRSFLSFARHDYYRRILCDLLGEEIEPGLIPESAAREILPKLC